MPTRIKLLALWLLLLPPLLGQGIGGKAGMGGNAGIGGGAVANTYNSCLIHAWPMTEGSGTVFHDIIGSDDLTLTGGGAVTWQANTGMPGTTPYFNGPGHATAPYDAALDFDGSHPFSVIAWTVGGGSAGESLQQWIVGNENWSSPYQGWGVFQDSNNGAANDQNAGIFSLVNSDSNAFLNTALQVSPNTVPISSATLHFYGLSYSGNQLASGVTIVQDGTTYSSANSNLYVVFNSLSGTAANGNAIQVGDAPGGGIPFTGAISKVAIYNCALSASQMLAFEVFGPRIN